MTYMRRAALAAAIVYTVSAFAALSPQHQEWGSGPVQWIMTADEQRQWKQLATDDDAEKFIQLFWARRDPAFRDEFDRRVLDADKRFADYNSQHETITRGAMSDRGRVLIVVGYPEMVKQRLHEARKPKSHELWIWEKNVAKEKFAMPYVEIGFFEDAKGVFHRDTQDTDFASASAVALKKMIVRPDLKELPKTAEVRPLRPVAVRKGEPGAHHLLLLKDLDAIVLSDTADPLAGVETAVAFAKSDDLGYVVEYCGDKDPVKISLAIRGTVGKKKVNINAPPADAHPVAMTPVPGCGIVRASIPLSDLPLTPGTYTFAVRIDDGTQNYTLSQDFRLE